MKLPDPVAVSPAVAIELARRHGIHVDEVRQIESGGIINSVFSLDDRYVLRVPRHHEAHVEHANVDAVAIPLAVAAGVRTPGLVAFDDSCDVLPVPFLIMEFAAGQSVEPGCRNPHALDALWADVGRDLARLHTGVDPDAWPRNNVPRRYTAADSHALIAERVDEGWISYIEAGWLGQWIEQLGQGLDDWARCATHGDVQMSNVLMHEDGAYSALLDWGCAAAVDPVADFMPLPLGLVPPMLAGHREVAPLPDDANAERRILLIRLRTWLQVMSRGAAPAMTWGERPGAWLADLLRFFVDPPSETWRELRPPTGEPPI